MDGKAVKEITSQLDLLYVEDDEALRAQTSKFFGHLFNKVDTAIDGKEGLDMFLKRDYDLIITDINMPIMNGVEFCRKIRYKNTEIPIIITSAHDESKYLLELIDIGIDKFILKPLDISKLISTLFLTGSNLVNKKLISKYQKEIESANIKLKQNNNELETLVKILDTKIEQQNSHVLAEEKYLPLPVGEISTLVSSKPDLNSSVKQLEGDLYLYNEYILEDDLQKLNDLSLEINSSVEYLTIQNCLEKDRIFKLSRLFKEYAEILISYPIFNTLGENINTLGTTFINEVHRFSESFEQVSILLKSFLYVLKKWKNALFINGVKSPHIYDASMRSDIETIILILRQEQDLIEQTQEFF